MKPFDKNVRILSDIKIDVRFRDVEKKIKTSANSPEIMKTAREALERIQGKWAPAVLFQWFDFETDKKAGIGRIIPKSGDSVPLNLGHSIRFLEQARYVMVSSYTIGQAFDTESAEALSNGSMLEAYLLDLIGLTALDKTCDIVIKNAENEALKLGWGVGPFLSPGSVHGWELTEQSKICSLLPLERINITLKNDTVLFPLKSICAIIGMGPGYNTTKVGSACNVCNKRNECDMRQI